ncbi:hypothetical protein Q7C36_012225 [Tachysurus vachellii]|uniref:Uncharacterized protein n=1 Tax=Tachysurus vachellii TaxID=175792 RepID=A0AA88SLE0_TACVA|nr:hypothetical protein Q7C36_012225 [Tachysurus vachellii]
MIFFGHPEYERRRGLRAATCWETAFRKEEWGLKWELEEEKRGFWKRNLFDVQRNRKSVWAIRGGEVFTYRRFNILYNNPNIFFFFTFPLSLEAQKLREKKNRRVRLGPPKSNSSGVSTYLSIMYH